MIVHAYGGLCNRMRVVLSYQAVHGEIGVVWLPDEEIAFAHFLDVFEPVPGVTWIDEPERAEVRTLCAHPNAPGEGLLAYRSLRPLKGGPVLPRPYAAMHIRRTDHVGLAQAAGTYTDDTQFRDWLAHQRERLVYIATDNEGTQLSFSAYARTLGIEPMVSAPIRDRDAQRHTTLAHAVDDLFACAGASSFMGSGESSFSNTVSMLRRLGGWWS